MFWKTLVVALFAVGVFAEGYQLTEEIKVKLRNFVRAQCEEVNAGDKTDDVTTAVFNFGDCIKDLVNIEVLVNEVATAKLQGGLNDVSKKYCAKTPQLKTCIHTLLDGFEPCFGNITNDVSSNKNDTDQIIDYVCYKDGERIALFISEQGLECFRDKGNAITACAEKIKESVPSIEAENALSLPEKCAKYDELSACVVTALKECSTTTPGNMAESLFRHLRKSSTCNTALPKP